MTTTTETVLLEGDNFQVLRVSPDAVKPGDFIPGDGLVSNTIEWQHRPDVAIYTVDYDLEADRIVNKMDIYGGLIVVIRPGKP